MTLLRLFRLGMRAADLWHEYVSGSADIRKHMHTSQCTHASTTVKSVPHQEICTPSEPASQIAQAAARVRRCRSRIRLALSLACSSSCPQSLCAGTLAAAHQLKPLRLAALDSIDIDITGHLLNGPDSAAV